ncbi:MAG: efflux RND transporter periplasmic adaptor subunit [Alphaproteobacteria bacterium]
MSSLAGRLTLIGALVALVAGGGYVYWRVEHRNRMPEGIAWGNGRMEATEVDIAAKFPGRIEQVLVREGDDVSAGQLLVRVDAKSVRASLAQARARLDQAREQIKLTRAEITRRSSELALARIEANRSRTLLERGFSTQERVDRDRTRAETAEAALSQARAAQMDALAIESEARARIDEIEANLSDMDLYAPTAGRVLYRLAEPGEVLPSGGKALVVVDLDDLYMTIYLSEKLAGRVPVGADARLKLDAFPDRSFPARVSFVSSEAEFTPKEVQTVEERQKLVFRVKLSATDNHDRALKPGMPGVGYVKIEGATPWPAKLP